MARTMLNKANLLDRYWKEAVHTAVYILNRVQLRVNSNMATYELWYDRKPSLKHFRVFGSKCFIKRDEQDLGGFESQSDEGILSGHSTHRKAYKFYNKRLRKVVESVNVKVDEDSFKGNQLPTPYSEVSDDEDERKPETELEEEAPSKTPNRYVQKNHPGD